MNADKSKKAETEEALIEPMFPTGDVTPDEWYAYKAGLRHYHLERLRRGLITREQFERENPLARICGDLGDFMKKAQIDFGRTQPPSFLSRATGASENSEHSDGGTEDTEET